MRSYISIWGLYRANKHLFDGLTVPDSVNKNTLINSIFTATMDMETLYSDPLFMQEAITIWSDSMQDVFNRLAATLEYEYDPIENYNRYEEYTEPATLKTDTGTGTDTVESYTAGFDSSADPAATPQSTVKTKPGGVYTSQITDLDGGDLTRTGHLHGNIGVTTTQEMIRQEREISKFNLIAYITQAFKQEFCLLVY